jgi:glycosyltransferase involved in cell wall biosynthesis
LSLVALEALAAGVPVVSTDVAGMREVLSTGAGVIVAHDADHLAKAVVELLREPERRAAMGEEGRRLHNQRFSTARMVDQYLALYADLCGSQ